MKIVTILSAILFLTLNSYSEPTSYDKCMVRLTKEQLLSDVIELHCSGFIDNQTFTIEGFTIKFPGFPSEVIKGTRLNSDARLYARKLKANQMVTLFDIKKAYQEGKLVSEKEIPAFYIKIIESQIATTDLD